MIEILENLDVLTRRHLDLAMLTMGTVAFGSPATSIPRNRVVNAAASIVARARSGTNIDPEFYDDDGRRLTLDEVVDHVISSDGLLYLAGKLTYKVRAGIVIGFALYGSHLDHFSGLSSYEQFLSLFGAPDQVTTIDEPGGGPMIYHNRYWDSRKLVAWDEWDRRVSLANLGEFEGNQPGNPSAD